MDSNDGLYSVLYTESAWMSLLVPVTDLALLHVTVSRADESVGVNDTAVIEVQSGGQTLTTVSVPVLGVAYDQ